MNPQIPVQQPTVAPPVPLPESKKHSKAGLIITVLAVIFSILFAPLGFILSIIAIVLGSKSPSRIGIIVAGCFALFISIIVTFVMIVFVTLPALQRASLTYKDLAQQSQKVGNVKVSVMVPQRFELQTNKDGYASFAQKSSKDSGSQALLEFIVVPQPLTTDEIASSKSYTQTEEGKSVLTQLSGIYMAEIQEVCKNVSLGDIKGADVSGAAFAYRVDFTCDSEKTEGVSYKGTYIDAYTGKNQTRVLLAVNSKIASKDGANIKKTIQSITLKD